MDITCPTHGHTMVESNDQYGSFICEVKGCTVKYYPGKTSTPADRKTRQIRIQIHEMMDVFWKCGLIARQELYSALNHEFKRDIHIGQLNYDDCVKVLNFVTKLRLKINEIVRKEFKNASGR